MKKFFKKNWFNILFVVFLGVLFFNPLGVGTTIRASIIRLISFGPNTIDKEDRVVLQNYNWNLQDINGNFIDFNTKKNKVIFVSFWATWCPPCVAEMPSIQAFYDKYGEEVEFILVSDESPAKINAFMNKNGYDLPVYANISSPLPELESSTIPTSFLIDKNGGIAIKKKGAADWDSKGTFEVVEELIKD